MWVDVEQNSEDWFELRLKRATSSNFDCIMAKDGGPFGDPARRYAQKIALERITGKRDMRTRFTSKAMQDGTLLEPIARRMYERETLYEVRPGGIHITDTLGDSADGLIGKHGCLEIKVTQPAAFWSRLEKGGIDGAYKHQLTGHLLVGEKDWCDFCMLCPEFPEGKNLYIHRVYRDENMISKMKIRLAEFEQLVCKNVAMLK